MKSDPAPTPSTDAADPNRDGGGGEKETAVPSTSGTRSAGTKIGLVGANTDQAQVPTAAAKKSTSTRSVYVSSSTKGGTDGATGVGGDAVLSPTNANDGANNTSSFWENGLDPNGSPTTEMAMAGPTKSTTTETRDEVVVGHPVEAATGRTLAGCGQEEEEKVRRGSRTHQSIVFPLSLPPFIFICHFQWTHSFVVWLYSSATVRAITCNSFSSQCILSFCS